VVFDDGLGFTDGTSESGSAAGAGVGAVAVAESRCAGRVEGPTAGDLGSETELLASVFATLSGAPALGGRFASGNSKSAPAETLASCRGVGVDCELPELALAPGASVADDPEPWESGGGLACLHPMAPTAATANTAAKASCLDIFSPRRNATIY
jgi:hypothetical protein